LLARCAQGERTAFSELYEETSAHLFAVVLRILRRKDWAEETLQDAFVKIWQHARDYDPEKSAPFTWMVTIARNRALDVLRKVKKENWVGEEPNLELTADEAASPMEELLKNLEAKSIKHCLDGLDADQRHSIVLAYWRGLTHHDLARELKRPLGTVKAWVRRGMEKLRSCLES